MSAAAITVCKFEGRGYTAGEHYTSEDCSLRCRCGDDGTTVCGPMQCRRGLQKKGAFADDPFCQEREAADPDDRCCVLVVCSSSFEDGGHGGEKTRGTKLFITEGGQRITADASDSLSDAEADSAPSSSSSVHRLDDERPLPPRRPPTLTDETLRAELEEPEEIKKQDQKFIGEDGEKGEKK